MGCRSDLRFGAATLLLGLAACNSTPSAPPQIEIIAGANQQAMVGTTVTTSPRVRVRDQAGDLLVGAVVRFMVVSGGGTVLGDSVMTDTQGEAALGQWRLGTVSGGDTLRVTAAGVSTTATVAATALAAAPSSMRSVGGTLLVAVVGEPVTPPPMIRVSDVYDNPVPGVSVTFDRVTTDGFMSSTTSTTDAAGLASSGRWVIGGALGDNQATAHFSGFSVLFHVTGAAVAPVLSAQSVTSQAGYVSFPVPAIPRVIVKDIIGHPLPNIPVHFTIASTDHALLTGEFAVTDGNGIAAPVDWRLASDGSPSTVTAEIPGLNGPPVHFTATAGQQPAFTIDLRFLSDFNFSQRDAFVAAALHWMRVITGGLVPTPVHVSGGDCSAGLTGDVNETVKGVVIFASINIIDGPGGILGFAGPCLTRTGSDLPLVGTMTFDVHDLQPLIGTGQGEAVVTHEMGHVLGFGTLWYKPALTQGIGGGDPIFIGPAALGLWSQYSFLGYAGAPVPVENMFAVGTRDSHWRESVFDTELMTGFTEDVGVKMPLSSMTIAAMADLGYQVNFAAAEHFGTTLRAPGADVSNKVRLVETLLKPIGEVSPAGVMRRFVKQ